MAFKFCCENEIRRCSDPPKDFESLIPFVNQMFIGRIPLEFTLSYVSPDGKTINIENDEIYQNLLNNKPSGNVKIFINKKEQEPAEKQEVQEEKKEEAPEQNLQESNVVTHFEQEAKEEPVAQKPEEIPYAEQVKATQAERIARIVQETLREDMPYIISQVKEALVKEGFNFNKLLQDNAEKGPQYQEREHDWPAHPNPYYQAPYDVVRKPVPSSAEKKPDLLGKVFEAIADLPNKATEAIGNFVEKFDGEVYVECPEGRYRKDVVDKTHQLQEVFPDENRKEILDFVKGLPKNLELDQIADMFAHRKMNSNM